MAGVGGQQEQWTLWMCRCGRSYEICREHWEERMVTPGSQKSEHGRRWDHGHREPGGQRLGESGSGLPLTSWVTLRKKHNSSVPVLPLVQ